MIILIIMILKKKGVQNFWTPLKSDKDDSNTNLVLKTNSVSL